MLLSIPYSCDLRLAHFPLQLEYTIHECFTSWWAARHIDINRYNPVAASNDAIAVMIVPPAICTAAHANNPFRIWHLVIYQPQRRGHLVGECSGNYQDIRLPRRSSEYNP